MTFSTSFSKKAPLLHSRCVREREREIERSVSRNTLSCCVSRCYACKKKLTPGMSQICWKRFFFRFCSAHSFWNNPILFGLQARLIRTGKTHFCATRTLIKPSNADHTRTTRFSQRRLLHRNYPDRLWSQAMVSWVLYPFSRMAVVLTCAVGRYFDSCISVSALLASLWADGLLFLWHCKTRKWSARGAWCPHAKIMNTALFGSSSQRLSTQCAVVGRWLFWHKISRRFHNKVTLIFDTVSSDSCMLSLSRLLFGQSWERFSPARCTLWVRVAPCTCGQHFVIPTLPFEFELNSVDNDEKLFNNCSFIISKGENDTMHPKKTSKLF